MAHWRGVLILFVDLHGLYAKGLLSSVDLSEIKITSYSLDQVQEVPKGEQLKSRASHRSVNYLKAKTYG